MNHRRSLSLSEPVESERVRGSMLEFVSCPACMPCCGLRGFRQAHSLRRAFFHLKKTKQKGSETISQAGLFILHLGFNPFPFALSVPAGGRRNRHQVSTLNDNTCASAAF